MRNRRNNTEAGFIAGFTTVGHAPTAIVGERYFWDVQSRHAPDVVVEAVMLVLKDARPDVEATAWNSYSIDAITNILLGAGWFSKTADADVVAGFDVRIGRFRFRPTWRLREGSFNSRLTMTF